MKVMTRKIKPMRVAYMRHVGPYDDTKQTWFDLMARLSADKQIRKRSLFIGIGHDNPLETPAAELRYDACITVDEEYKPKRPVELQTIAGGDYAVAKNCAVGKIKEAFQYLFGKWLARSSRELRAAPSFMVFARSKDTTARAKQRVDIYMALQPKRSVKKAKQMKIQVTTLEPRRVAYMRHVGPYNGARRLWLDFRARLKKDGLPRKDSLFIGVPMDNPKTTPQEKLRYDVCMTVDAKYVPRKPVRVRTIAGGDYVVARNCPFGSIARGYETLFRSWLPKSGRQARKGPSLLVDVNGAQGTPPAFRSTDIYVPLETAEVESSQ
jgi:DNA gyrase inhibitor GyrI